MKKIVSLLISLLLVTSGGMLIYKFFLEDRILAKKENSKQDEQKVETEENSQTYENIFYSNIYPGLNFEIPRGWEAREDADQSKITATNGEIEWIIVPSQKTSQNLEQGENDMQKGWYISNIYQFPVMENDEVALDYLNEELTHSASGVELVIWYRPVDIQSKTEINNNEYNKLNILTSSLKKK